MLGQLVSAGRRVAGFGAQEAAAQTVQPQYVWCCSLQTADKTWCYLLRHSDVYELELWEVNKQGAPRRIDANVFSSIITPEGVQFGSSSCRFTAITACKGSQLSVQTFSPEGSLLLLDQRDDGLRVWELPVPLSTGRPYWPQATNGGLFNEDVGAAQLRRHVRPDDNDLMPAACRVVAACRVCVSQLRCFEWWSSCPASVLLCSGPQASCISKATGTEADSWKGIACCQCTWQCWHGAGGW